MNDRHRATLCLGEREIGRCWQPPLPIDRIQGAHPKFNQSRYPDFRRWSESGSRVSRPPISVEELQAKVNQDPGDAVAYLRQFENVGWSSEETSWEDALSLVTATVGAHPDTGFALIGTLPAISSAVVKGWARASLEIPIAETVARRLDGPVLADTAREVAAMLGGFGMSRAEATAWHQVPGADQLADKTWAAIDGKPPRDLTDGDWVSQAINLPGGQLAEFWLHAIENQWRSAGDSWPGLPIHFKAQLEKMIAGSDDRAAAAQVFFSSHLVFLHAADATWTESAIVPLLNWSDEQRARRTWDGVLASARWNDRLLDAGLRDFLLDTAERADQFGYGSKQELQRLLANVSVHGATDPLSAGWLARLTRVSSNESRVAWIRDVQSELDRVGPDVAESQWTRWMRTYWQDRLDSKPKGLTELEASAIACWSFALIDSAADAVALSLQRPAAFETHTDVLDQMKERAATMPVAHVDLLVHLLRGTKPPFHEGYLLQNIVKELRSRRPAIDVVPIVEEAVRLGFSEAASW